MKNVLDMLKVALEADNTSLEDFLEKNEELIFTDLFTNENQMSVNDQTSILLRLIARVDLTQDSRLK